MAILIATRNRHKLEEIREILSDSGIELLGLDDCQGIPEVEEDRDSFEGNAIKKAEISAKTMGRLAMADDSGLEVDALGGAPGVYSARYSGEPVSYRRNNQKLLKEMDGVSDRSARFVCVVALCGPAGECRTVRGTCEGIIAEERRGDMGFGYDPLFIPDGESRTFAEMEEAEKNRLSHRYRAFERAKAEWGDLLRQA